MSELPSSASTKKIPGLLIPVVLVSLVLGGLSGGLVGYTVATKYSPANAKQTVGSNTVTVKEDSATVDVVKKVSPAVVSIIISKDLSKVLNNQPTSPFDDFFGQPLSPPQGKQEIGGGSGFIVAADGLIVTNKHVVDDDQAEYTVVMNDGKTYSAKVVAKDPSNDVAVIQIAATNLPTIDLGESNSVVIGQTVIAIGNALGQYRNTVTRGVISGLSRTITASDTSGQSETLEDVFQTDAAINPGNSGGPLLNLAGQAIAVNTAVNSSGQSIGFAIPIDVIKRDIQSIKDNGKIVRPFLGVRYVLLTDALAEKNNLPVKTGAWIQPGDNNDPAIVADSPAAQAGLKENDIIQAVDGQPITVDRSLAGLLNKYNVGDTITLKVVSGKETKDLKVTLAERPQS